MSLKSLWVRLSTPLWQREAPLIRWMVGAVFLSEGIQKFLFVEQLGAGRFVKIGIPAPEFFGPFVGVVEILGGFSILTGFLTRLASVPLLINISVAILTTKIPMLLSKGFWSMAHESRTDYAMLLGLVFLLSTPKANRRPLPSSAA